MISKMSIVIIDHIARLGHQLRVAIAKNHFIMDHKYRDLVAHVMFAGGAPIEFNRCLKMWDGNLSELKVTRRVEVWGMTTDGKFAPQRLGFSNSEEFVYIHDNVSDQLMVQILGELMVSQTKVNKLKKLLQGYRTNSGQTGFVWDKD